MVCIWKVHWGVLSGSTCTGGAQEEDQAKMQSLKACLGLGWPVELSPTGSREQDFICQHQAVIGSVVAPGKGVCSWGSHQERLCCEQRDTPSGWGYEWLSTSVGA